MENELHKIGVKFYAVDADDVELVDVIPVFHRWIQERLCDNVLIDVADYSHVHHGPGILLVAHEGNYSLDESGGRRGLVYYSKRDMEGSLVQRMERVIRLALEACRLLEDAPELGERIRFSGSELELFVNDRLAAPNNARTLERVEPALRECLARLYPAGVRSLSRDSDPKSRFTLEVTGNDTPSAEDLYRRLA